MQENNTENALRIVGDLKPSNTISFYTDMTLVGTIDLNGHTMSFTGNADESARAFLQAVGNVFERRLKEEYQKGFEAGKNS